MIVSKAPGRVCLFGDHQDYLGLPIIACAIDKYITLSATKNNSDFFLLNFLDLNTTRKIDIRDTHHNISHDDFLILAIRVLKRYGCIPTTGYNIEVKGSIPMNAGLSSSSALVVAWVNFLVQTFGTNQSITQELIAKIAYEAEVAELGNPGGKMDQYSIGLGNIIYLETDKKSIYETIGTHLDGLVVGESGIPKDTLGLLADRKTLALKGIAILKNKFPKFNVKTISENEYEQYASHLSGEIRPYFYAAVHNHMITQKALLEFKKDNINLTTIGELMNAHHTILKEVLKITVPKIDRMIDTALNVGALGAKIVGSGGGGSIVVLAPNNQEKIINALKKSGAEKAYPVSVSKGVKIIKQKNAQ
ncbi:galactokinase [Saonia flava]|uniref:Galactokinase n=1 Tax=Saonia flava TaxID=523696 RepID=A0A846QSG6_9FLAO|nr:galactokinase family protein [Saonia flava]NJB71101.1 galactokinase [Saonia flava]